MTTTTAQKVSTAAVRKFYKDQGCEVRITRDGHVTYRKQGDTIWLEGRWVGEYKVDDQFGVVCA